MRPPSAVSRTELAAAAATKPQLPAYGELQVRVGPPDLQGRRGRGRPPFQGLETQVHRAPRGPGLGAWGPWPGGKQALS